MSVPDPVNGNANFTTVTNKANQVEVLDVSKIKVTDLLGGDATLNSLANVTAFPGLGTLKTVVGYAPTGFNVTPSGSGVFLNTTENQAPALVSTDQGLLVLPAGAVILSMRVTNNGTTITSDGGANFNIATQAWTATATAVTGHRLVNEMELNTVNSAGGGLCSALVGAVVLGDEDHMNLGQHGIPFHSTADDGPFVVVAGDQNVGVLVNHGSLTAGDMAVSIEYLE
jgi:hypothetical protein